MDLERTLAIKLLAEKPYLLGHKLGFTKLTELHNDWICDMIHAKEDETLQAHRGSYKTTCVSIALAVLMGLEPTLRIAFLRKTDKDVQEVIKQVKKILLHPIYQELMRIIWGVPLILTVDNSRELDTSLNDDNKGTSQLVGFGCGSSMTGKHFDRIFTDDIVNVNDRVSQAEREATKLVYFELQNIKNRGGVIFNTGTPWHKNDAFEIMPEPQKYDCYSTGLISDEELQRLKQSMIASLFCANYELRHIASEDVIFNDPVVGGDPAMAEQGFAHVDSSYGGGDYTAFTICRKYDGKYYVYGRLWKKHIDDLEDNILQLCQSFNAGKIWTETNGDKGYVAKDLKAKGGRVAMYHENMNKFLKITTYLKGAWNDVIFVQGTDKEYIEQICDYNENAQHDDAPDSLSSLIRLMWNKHREEQYDYLSRFGKVYERQ